MWHPFVAKEEGIEILSDADQRFSNVAASFVAKNVLTPTAKNCHGLRNDVLASWMPT